MSRRMMRLRRLLFIFLLLAASRPGLGYSVLTHEEMVDLLWDVQIETMLRHRFPQASEDDLRKAHAFAYGGALIADMGYYPFGSKYFSDLLHYVRSGDFVVALVNDASDLDGYAFALGALSHYISDNTGHPTINRVVAIEFPKLESKYGVTVRYAEDPKAHIRTEFGFDMVQVAKSHYASDRYHDFIGFEVEKNLLEQAFQETYGMPLHDVIKNEDLAIGTFRRAVSEVIPEMTRVALLARKQEIVKDTPNFDEKKFRYYLSRKEYEKDWGTKYRKPGLGGRVLALFLRLVPKIGPFSALAFKIPTTQTEDMYIKSVNLTVENYGKALQSSRQPGFALSNKDCDTGRDTAAGEYQLTDKSYERLLNQHAEDDFRKMTPALRLNILNFYEDLNAPIWTKRSAKAWQSTLTNLTRLRASPPPVRAASVEEPE